MQFLNGDSIFSGNPRKHEGLCPLCIYLSSILAQRAPVGGRFGCGDWAWVPVGAVAGEHERGFEEGGGAWRLARRVGILERTAVAALCVRDHMR
jgi:hypothetical protein